MGKIGAYYQCYKRNNCVDFVLNNYRKFYSDSSVILVCDGGNDHTDLSNKYNCKYFYDQKIGTQKNLLFNDVDSIFTFFERMSKYINLIDEDFFILLEDDVYIMNEISYDDLKYDINGCNFGETLDTRLNHLLKTSESRYYLGACGGSILRTSFFKEIFSNMDSVRDDIKKYCYLTDSNRWASDQIITFLCWKYNGTIGQYNGFCETWYDDYNKRKDDGSIEVLHQYKELY